MIVCVSSASAHTCRETSASRPADCSVRGLVWGHQGSFCCVAQFGTTFLETSAIIGWHYRLSDVVVAKSEVMYRGWRTGNIRAR